MCYLIFNFEEFGLGLKEYVYLLEEVVICVCVFYGVVVGWLEKVIGVWLEGDMFCVCKICVIGVRSSYYVIMYGLVLNVNIDLCYFSYIYFCGFIDKGVILF